MTQDRDKTRDNKNDERYEGYAVLWNKPFRPGMIMTEQTEIRYNEKKKND